MKDNFYGMHWMLATPFNEQENVDTPSISRLIKKARETGCRGVVALGVTGEAARLTDKERTLVAEKVIEGAEGMPVTLGASAGSTQATIERCREASRLGASAIMVAAPPMAKANLEVLFAYYQRIADAVTIPIVVQDYPQASGVQMPVEFIARLAENIPTARYLKLEDPPTPTKLTAIHDLVGHKMGIFGGLGGVFLLNELVRGSAGAMTGFAYPEILVEVCQYMADGDREKAEEVFFRHLPLILFESQEGISLAIRKEALYLRGLLSTPKVRHPGAGVQESTRRELQHLMSTLNL